MTLVALMAISAGAWAEEVYYLCGSMNDYAQGDAAYEMTYNESANAYTLTTTLSANDQFKVVSSTRYWYPEGMGNEYVMIASGTYTIYFNPAGNVAGWHEGYINVVEGSLPDVPGTVELNSDKTVATMTMPASDVTVNYELVRVIDDDTYPVVFSGIPTGNDAIVKKGEGNKYMFVTAPTITLTDPLASADAQNIIESADLVIEVYTCKQVEDYWIIDIDEDPIKLKDFLANPKPGRYTIQVSPTVDTEGLPTGLYDGVVFSTQFTLFEAYEVTIPAGEYITYYRDEALYTDNENAKLYTITAVNEATATATELTVAPALTPILVQNNAETVQSILLIPTTTTDVVNFYDGFRGTLTERNFSTADMEEADYYVANGKQFVWVNGAGTLPALHCWIQLAKTGQESNAAQLRVVFDEVSAIESIEGKTSQPDGLFDLNGRRQTRRSGQKGVFILNGKKVEFR